MINALSAVLNTAESPGRTGNDVRTALDTRSNVSSVLIADVTIENMWMMYC